MADLLKIKQVSGLSTSLAANATLGSNVSDALVSEIAATSTDVDSLETKISDDIAAAASDTSTDIASLDGYVDNVSSSLGVLSGALSQEIAATSTDVDSLDTRITSAEGDTTAVSNALVSEIAATSTDIASIEAAFVKDPLGVQRFAGSTALDTANATTSQTLGYRHVAVLTSAVEDNVVGNIIGVYINGLVADPAYYLVADGGSSNSEVTFETSYTLDANDTIVVKFVTN